MLKILLSLKKTPETLFPALTGHEVNEADGPDDLLDLVKHGNYHLVLAEDVADLPAGDKIRRPEGRGSARRGRRR